MQEVTQQRFVYNRTTQYVAVRDVSVAEKGMTTYPSLPSQSLLVYSVIPPLLYTFQTGRQGTKEP